MTYRLYLFVAYVIDFVIHEYEIFNLPLTLENWGMAEAIIKARAQYAITKTVQRTRPERLSNAGPLKSSSTIVEYTT